MFGGGRFKKERRKGWSNWVPGYVRQEIKRQTGVKVDSKGRVKRTKKVGDIQVPNSWGELWKEELEGRKKSEDRNRFGVEIEKKK